MKYAIFHYFTLKLTSLNVLQIRGISEFVILANFLPMWHRIFALFYLFIIYFSKFLPIFLFVLFDFFNYCNRNVFGVSLSVGYILKPAEESRAIKYRRCQFNEPTFHNLHFNPMIDFSI